MHPCTVHRRIVKSCGLKKKKKKRGRKREIENIDTHKSYPNTHLEAKNSDFL